MKHYIEITLLPNPDINLFSLWSKVFQQIHLGLVAIQDEQGRIPVGLSFPEYVTGEKYSVLGGKLRLFADNEATLSQFDVTKYLSRLSDYVHYSSIRPVPDKLKGYAIYQRIQPKTSAKRLARRYAKRHNMDIETALTSTVTLNAPLAQNSHYKLQFRYCDMPDKAIKIPFIRLQSLSSAQLFCLWIKKSVATEAIGCTFSNYGLSATSTVPDF